MSDLRERMQVLDGVEAPELWSRVRTHVPPPPPGPRTRVAATAISLLVAVAAATGVYLAYRDTAREPIVPGPKPNGPIYFLGRPDIDGGGAALYVVGPDGGNFKKVSVPGRISSPIRMAASPDGRFLAVSTGGFGGSSDLFVMEPDGSGLRQITKDEVVGLMGGHQDVDPAWSSDATKIVFASTRCCDVPGSQGNFALYEVRPDGSDLRQITDGSASLWAPAWSPDGTLIAHVNMFDEKGWQIGVVNADGSGQRTLTHDDRINDVVAWSPDGEYLAYGSAKVNGVEWEIRLIRPDGTGQATIYRCEDLCYFGGYSLEWSPDGKEIAFTFARVRGRGLVWHIGIVNADGSEFRVLDTHGIETSYLSWVPLE